MPNSSRNLISSCIRPDLIDTLSGELLGLVAHFSFKNACLEALLLRRELRDSGWLQSSEK